MRAAACDPMPKVLCGWPRSHLLSSMLAVQRLAGWSRDPSSMGLRRSSIHGSVHLARPRRRWRWMLSKQSSVTLERSCSTGRGCRITRGWRAEARDSRLATRSAVLAKVRLIAARAGRVGAASTVGWEELCAFRGVGGDPTGPWPGHRHARITQRRRVGELQLELYFLAVSGQFHELVKRRENRLRASRALSGGAPGRAQPVGNARHARRCLAGLARGTGSGRAKCT